jgi:hypothetical protein
MYVFVNMSSYKHPKLQWCVSYQLPIQINDSSSSHNIIILHFSKDKPSQKLHILQTYNAVENLDRMFNCAIVVRTS